MHGASEKFQDDPHWRDYPLFYEYFHGDTGAGVGASHQTGWTGAIARIMHLLATTDAQTTLDQGKARTVGGKAKPAKKTMTQARYPSLYQINTRVWLTALSATLGRRAQLDDVPDAELDRLAAHGLRLGLVAERVADRPGGAGDLAREPGMAPRVRADPPGPEGRGHRRLGVRDPGLHACIAISAATPRSHACASGSRSADSS